MYILHIPSWFPNDQMPFRGNFIEKHIAAISMTQKCVTLRVVRSSEPYEYKKGLKGEEVNRSNVLVEFFIKNRTSYLGKVWMRMGEWYYYRKGMKTIVEKFGKPALIHLHVALPMGLWAVKWSKKWRIHLVLTEHWSIYNSVNRELISPSLNRKLKNVFKNISGITTVSDNLLQCIHERAYCNMPQLRKNNVVIYNVVNTELFLPKKNDNSPKRILHVSTLEERSKNFLGILEGIKLLSEKRQDFILEVIHEFRNEKAEEYVKNNRLENFAHFLGSMPEEQVAAKMRSCDFLLLFSNYENLPCVLLEAMSCGKPVITTPVGGIPEVMNEEKGIFVEPKNVNQLVEKLEFMLDNFESFDPNIARNYAITHFSKEIIGKQFLKFYKTVLHSDHIN
jgi:glycosyltransferase involved in cell wall biosynthesis